MQQVSQRFVFFCGEYQLRTGILDIFEMCDSMSPWRGSSVPNDCAVTVPYSPIQLEWQVMEIVSLGTSLSVHGEADCFVDILN